MIIAHRGFSYAAPENTRASFRLAWQAGAPAAECDVYLTKDRQIMLMHDKTAKRTGGADLMMEETDSADLRKLDVGSWKDLNYAGEKIPFLEEILETIPKGRILFIEIKCGPEILPYLKELIDQSGREKQLTIISFNLDVAAGAKHLMPRIPVYWLVGTEEDKQTGKPIPHSVDLIRTAAEKGLDGLDLHYKGITEEFARQVFEHKLKLYAWTVDDLQEARRLAGMGICGITTNRPDYLMKNLSGKESIPEVR
jgi:glycerophosphoryl diester phosphodiesterase